MEQRDGNKYSTYILELVRNNGITNDDEKEMAQQGMDGEVSYRFLLFDYFDMLYCKELRHEDKKYLNYLSIENVFEDTIQHSKSYKVSYKTLSLYCKSDNEWAKTSEKPSNIFSITGTGENLSDIPFLGLIQISLCKANYVRQNKEEIDIIDIDNFLKVCENRILEIANNHIGPCARMQLFRSSTTGDFCLAVRTDSIKAIYNIAIALNGTQNNSEEKIKMLTFTNVGIECKYLEGKGYATLDKEFVSRHPEIVIALRFSADELLREVLQKYIEDRKSEGVKSIKGLFGRYEYLLYISLDEFANLYPFLCEKKIGRSVQKTEESELEKSFRKFGVRNINERILVGLDVEISETESVLDLSDTKPVLHKADEDSTKEKKEVLCRNKELFERIDNLKKFKLLFHEEHFAFQDLIRGMKEIYKAFSPTGMDKESYINWCIFHKDMNVLCKCIEQMMTYYKYWIEQGDIGESDKKWYRGIVLGDWRNNLQAINRYTTLVQNVNYQTYQSPIYEIQTQIDTEKAMVAYREAMELYITGAIQEMSKKEKTDNTVVYPIIYPDLSKDTVEVAAPFMVKRPAGIMVPGEIGIMPYREIICTVPSFEYFGRLYDLLPWIIHETSHHLRVTDREERNQFVTEYIFSYIFKEVMSEPMRQLSDSDFYKDFGRAERYLISSMAEVAEKEIFSHKDFVDFNFERLILEIEKWLKRMFPLGVGYRGKVYAEEEKLVKKKMFNFWLDAYRKEEMLSDENLDMILRTLDDHEDLEEKEELAKRLLDKYYDNFCKELNGNEPELKVYLEDVYDDTQMETKLTKLAGVPEEKKVFVRTYCDQVITVYRIMKINLEETDKDSNYKKTEEYLKKVFELYTANYKEKVEKNNMVVDTVSMHIIRNLGLLNGDSDFFIKQMKEIVHSIDNAQVMEHKEIKQKIYLEAYADLLMATSLKLTGFGYCRQVLQTMSDAKLMDKEYKYEDINYERWRTVAAVLLVGEGAGKSESDGVVQVDAKDLIEKGKKYCEYIIRHISEKLSKKKELSLEDEAKKEEYEKKRELLREFLCDMNAQIGFYIDGNESEINNSFLLHILLQADISNKDKKIDIKDKEIEKEWEKVKDVAELCSEYKYNFWRIDCFCRGIGNIVQDGKIIVSQGLFYHMKKIREKVNGAEAQGCVWEKKNKFLTEPKRDVGDFYNAPEQVYMKTPAQKLDNTIEFIQNYYYYNRFRVVNENSNSVIKVGMDI